MNAATRTAVADLAHYTLRDMLGALPSLTEHERDDLLGQLEAELDQLKCALQRADRSMDDAVADAEFDRRRWSASERADYEYALTEYQAARDALRDWWHVYGATFVSLGGRADPQFYHEGMAR